MGSSCVVGWIVSTHPPWSTATSTITAPFFIRFRSSRSTSLGALAPGTSTDPTGTPPPPRSPRPPPPPLPALAQPPLGGLGARHQHGTHQQVRLLHPLQDVVAVGV